MQNPIEVARYLAKSHLTALVNAVGSEDFHREKLAASSALFGASRYASLTHEYTAAPILDRASDGLFDRAMSHPATAGAHIRYLIAQAEAAEGAQ